MRKTRSVSLTLALVLAALPAGNGGAATLNVPSTSYPTIQSAIDAAVDGVDEVVVGDGTYTGAGNTRLDFLGKDIRVRSANGAASTVIDCEGLTGCWGVRFGGDETAAAVFEGFTVTKATASAVVIEGTSGTSPRIVDCVLERNRAAPGSDEGGGGIRIFGLASPTVTGCSFRWNVSEYGGAVYMNGGSSSLPSAVISRCTFTDNSVLYYGGAIMIRESERVEISECRFEKNTAGSGGGAIWSFSPCTVSRSVLAGNEAGSGGAIYGSAFTLHESFLSGNSAVVYGGALALFYNSRVINCTISDNNAATRGGGVSLQGTGPSIFNSILWGNKAPVGGSLYVSGPATIGNCDIEGGLASIGGTTPNTDGQIIDVDPRFALPGDYHLLPDSPCVDAGAERHRLGLPATDLDGGPRSVGVVDIGAHEFGKSSNPVAAVSPASLTFKAVEGGARPDPQILSIRNSGNGNLTWTISTSDPWLAADPVSGESAGEVDSINISVDSAVLSRGVYTGSIEVSDSRTVAVLRTVPVTLVVTGTLSVCLPAGTCAYDAIQDAVDDAEDGDVVLVADGTYTGERNRNLNMRGKAIVVRSENGPQSAIIDGESLGRGFIFESFESEDSVVQGFTIRNGSPPSGTPPGDQNGGGIFVASGSPRIIDCRLESNHASRVGGGLAIESSGVQVRNCQFAQNEALLAGGGAYVTAATVTFSGCRFSGNTTGMGGNGGGLYLSGPNFSTIENCIFEDNDADRGGGLYVTDHSSGPDERNVVRESRFEGNRAVQNGGGAYWEDLNGTITNCVFQGNMACGELDGSARSCLRSPGDGGGAYLWTHSSTHGSIVNSTFSGNQAGTLGGGLCTNTQGLAANPPEVFNTLFWGNTALGDAVPSGMDIYDVSDESYGVLFSYCAFDFNASINKYWESKRVEGANLTAASPPGFVDQAAGDLRLLRSSRCIDKGTTINSLFSDHRGSVRAVDGGDGSGGAPDGTAQFDIGAFEYSEYYGGITEDQTARAFKNLRVNGSVLVTNHEYQVEWSDKEPFPSDRRISQAGEYEVRLALVDAAGLRIDLGTWTMQLSQAGYKIPVSFGPDHLGTWRIRLELVADPGQNALSDEVPIWYKTPQVRYLGEQIIPPADADPSVKPDVQLESIVHWSADTNRLYAIAPASTVVTWYADEERTIPLPTVLYIARPPAPQRHIAGTQPVELLPLGTAFDGVDLMWTDGDATIAGNRFASSLEGWSVLMYRDNEAADPDEKERFEVVRTLAWNHPADPVFPNDTSWDIGLEITDEAHDQAECGSGYVFFEAGPYDGHGESRAYDREIRQGQIFGVNDDDTAPGGGDFVVVWYQKSQVADACWPFKPSRYDLRWPAAPGRIVIADQSGSGPLDPGTYGALENMLVYDQPAPAFPGYNPNEEHASFFAARDSELPAVYALRADLNRTAAPPYTSEPYVLLKYREPLGGRWQFKVYRVEVETVPPGVLAYPATAGGEIGPPYPLNQFVFGPCAQSATVSSVPDEVLRDKNGTFFAVQGEKSVVMRYYYRLRPGFHFDPDGDGIQDASVGTCVPWLDFYADTTEYTPADVTYNVAWPEQAPTLLVGETLTDARTLQGEAVGLPNVKDQCVVDKLYDEAGVRLIDPVAEHRTALSLGALAGIKTEPAVPFGSRVLFVDLPFHLQSRLTYDAVEEELKLEGLYRSGAGEPLLLLNTLTEREVAVIVRIQSPPGNPDFLAAVSALKTAGDAGLAGVSTLKDARMKALSAGDVDAASRWPYDVPTNTYVTLAFNDDPDCSAPTTLSVLKVGCPLSAGEIKVIEPPNPFDEKVTLRHTGDFAGNADARWFQWKYLPADFSGIPSGPDDPDELWSEYGEVVAVPNPTPPPDELPPEQKATGETFYRGAVDVTIQGTGQQLLADTWFATRYYYPGVCGNPDPSQDAANFSAWTKPQLYEGWVKRVMKNVNLFDQKVKDFHASEVSTLSSMISLAGKRYGGDVALSDEPGYLQGVGLIELYETLLRRALGLSIDAGSNDPSRNKAVLLAANRIAGLYLLLGNEAYADAADPTIGFSTVDGQYGTEAPAVFSFQNQADTLLEEELALLRGRADAGVQPFHNRLVWNFTIDDGEVAYRENYNITDQNQDGEINEQDAMIQYPQGHGDAWGHYLTAVKKYYQLITHDSFTWIPQSEAILVGQVPVSVDYRDERRFAEAAAAKARAGSEIVGLTYRERYDEDPEKQWQGYRDEDRSRAWGVDDWAARAGQGAILDWVIGNALLPPDTPDDQQERVFSAVAGQTRFELPPQFNHVTLRVAVSTVPQAPGTYTVVGEEDVVTGEWMTVVTFAVAPNAGDQVSFRIDVAPEGIAKIDRTTVVELREIASHLGAVQAVLDQADVGLNPLGVAKEAVPFDIDPARVAVGETHFEQVYGRAAQAMNNAIAVFNHANQSTQLLRRQQDRLEDFKRNVVNAEADFNNRLIEIFGYPYADDCGVGKTYEADYCETGPDLYHFMYVDPSELMGVTAPKAHTFAVTFKDIDVDERGALQETEREVLFHADTDSRFGLVKPEAWQGRRKAPGEIQLARSDLLQQRGRFESAILEYGNLLDGIEKQADLIEAQHDVNREEILILNRDQARQKSLNASIKSSRAKELLFRKIGSMAVLMSNAIAEAFPTSAGFATDFTSAIRSAIRLKGAIMNEVWTGLADAASMTELSHQQAKEIVSAETNIALTALRGGFAVRQELLQLENMVRSEATQRHGLHVQWEGIAQSAMRYQAALARGERLLADRLRFRRQTAAQIQDHRYKDMTFRIFRNDALQKYRAQFDMASRYVYLAAKAYDYETTLLDSSGMAGQSFLSGIVRQRTIGMIADGQPLTGSGLADPMRRLWQNFQVLKPQLGFNNPQQETNRFSLRSEMFRILPLQASNDAWRDALKGYRVGDLWQVPEFRRYCRPFAAEGIPEPGIVIPFRTTVTSRLNFFGWPLAAGDSYYSSSNFATKVRSVGVWFSNYNRAGLAQTPRIYLVPAGEDVLRSPTYGRGDIRTWHVVDQKLPAPFPINAPEMESDASWIPSVDTINDEPFQIRRHSDFKAYHDSGYLDKEEMTYDTRLIGRSVWNSRWLLIIPGASLLYEPDEGLDTFIDGPEIVGGNGERSGYGISDIRIFFETYAYSGN